MKFSQFSKSLKEPLEPAYLIEGEEAYFRDHAYAALKEVCALAQPSLNEITVDGETLKGDLSSFLADLYVLPFFDRYRLVRVTEFYPGERELKQLSGYLARPSESTVLAVVNRGKKQTDLKKKLTFVDCSREDEETLARWLFGLMRRSSLSVDADVAALIVRFCNRDCARMKTETEKLALLLGKGGKVTREVAEEYIAKDADYKIYELTQAASRRNFTLFSEILCDLTAKGFDEYAVLAALTGHFRTLAEVSSMKGTDAEVAKVLGVKPYAVTKNRETAARIGKERVRGYYEALFSLSCAAKQGVLGKTGAFTAALAKIFFG